MDDLRARCGPFLRADSAVAAGLGAAFAFPVIVADKVVADPRIFCADDRYRPIRS